MPRPKKKEEEVLNEQLHFRVKKSLKDEYEYYCAKERRLAGKPVAKTSKEARALIEEYVRQKRELYNDEFRRAIPKAQEVKAS